MSQLTDRKKKRRVRRIIGLAVVGLVLVGGLIYWFTREEEPPTVRTAQPNYGSIRSVMMLSAEIQPGAILEQGAPQSQRVEIVHVDVGDQVKTGDALLTLDRSELLAKYEEAVSAREEIEASIAQADAAAKQQEAAAKAQAQASQQAMKQLEQQLNGLSTRLSGALAQLARVSSLQPVLVEVNPALSEQLARVLADFDPEAEDAALQLQAAIDLLNEGIFYSENPDYLEALQAMQTDLLAVSSLLPQLTGALTSEDLLSGLTAGLTSGLDLEAALPSDLTNVLGALGGSLESSLEQALQLEEQAKERYDQSVKQLLAKSDGVIAQVNVKPGDYTGPASDGAAALGGLDLQSLLGSGIDLSGAADIGGVSGSGSIANAITIYDNTRPQAVFKASQFDAGRLAVGMSVQYQYDERSFNGAITFIAPFASGGSFQSGTDSGLPTDLSAISSFGSEPWLEVQMSILGTGLTDLIPGFSIDAEIETATANNVLILPAEAMRRELDEYFVFVLRADNTLERRTFTPGIQSDRSVEVIDGLRETDVVILNPTSQLQEGLQVQVQNDAA